MKPQAKSCNLWLSLFWILSNGTLNQHLQQVTWIISTPRDTKVIISREKLPMTVALMQ